MIPHAGLRPQGIRRSSALSALAAGALAVSLAGCGGTAAELETAAAGQLQQRVLAVTKAAAGKNPAAALKSLDQLTLELDAAAAAGQVSFRRHQSITVAVNAVRADLAAVQAATKATAKAAPPASPATTSPVVVSPAPAPATGGQPGSGQGKSGQGEKGKGSDKGKG
ncbi:hypothetical protein SRABI83_00623 [Arthrobacter sp. Bi83]|uniref:mucin-associated surface protein n=1 Tax=Arthrobacter sp. Bi83 TaxID=2822353 RepID=UPI001D5879D7|nr:mucin-associated surface protein [Arthrobacter sp. Bi83]CAH0147333.1 hypothetical protein SRABI83_00623 [Arthrobacter sp. Bi83]